nr:MAG: protein of unknown function DUF3310 [Bacteriophage sp.]
MKDYYQIDKDHDLNSLLEMGLIKDVASFYEGNIFKYVYRHRNKNGLEDLKKARNYLNLLMELEYGAKTEGVEPYSKAKADAEAEQQTTATPLEKREEEKKYVVKIWDLSDNSSFLVKDRSGLLNILTTNDVDLLAPDYQFAFTKKEIDRLKATSTLNIDWDKAMEEYDG